MDQCPTQVELEVTLIHELVHLLTTPLWDEIITQIGSDTTVGEAIRKHFETLTDTVAIALYQLKEKKPMGAIFSPLKKFKE